MSNERGTSPAAPENADQILGRILDEGVHFLRSSLRPFLVSLGDQLFDLATGSGLSGSARQAHYDALNTLKRRSDQVQDRFGERLRQDLESLQKESMATNPFTEIDDETKLGLIDLDEMDRSITIEKIVSSLVEEHRVALECLTIRTARLAGIQPLKAKTPFHPAYVLRAFAFAIEPISEDSGVFIDAVEFYRDRYLSKLENVYKRLNKELADAGVEPDLEAEIVQHGSRLAPKRKRVVNPQGPSSPANEAREPPPATPEPPDAATAPDAPTKAIPAAEESVAPRDLYAMSVKIMNALDTTRSIAKAGENETDEKPRNETAKPVDVSQQEVLTSLAGLQESLTDEQLATGPRLEPLVKGAVGGDKATLNANSALRLGFVDNVFKTLENSYDISSSLAPSVSRLRIPLAHASVRDEDFFSRSDHPARNVIDQLSTLAAAEQQVAPGLQKRVASIVDRLNETFESDENAFSSAQQDLDKLVAQRNGAIEKNIERLVAGLDGQERLTVAKREVDTLLRDSIGDRETLGAMINLMDRGWHDAMVQVALREGVDSIAWREEAALLQDLQNLFEQRAAETVDETQLRELKPRLKALSRRITKASPVATGHEAAVQELHAVLTGATSGATTRYEPGMPAKAVAIDERVERLPKLRRWLNRVRELRVGTRMRYRDKNGKDRRMQLVWVSEDREQFTFANEVGQKIADLSAVQLARQLSRGFRPMGQLDKLGAIDRSVYTTLEDAQKALSRQRTRDPVTRLINGDTLLQQVRRSLRHAQRHDSEHAFLLLDIDNFALVNEVFDETSGDQVLKEFAESLARLNDARTLSARMGDDDFGVLLTHRSLEDAREMADKLRSDIALQSFAIGDDKISFTISVGVVPILQSTASEEAVLEQARGALEIAKSQGRNQVSVYDSAQQERRQYQIEREETQQRLEEAIATDGLVLRAQPIAQSAVGREEAPTHYYEVLLAIRDETGNVASPQEFITTAERFGFASQVDRWVLQETFAWISELVDKQKFVPQLSINLSGASITSDDFLEFVLEQISEYGVGTNRLCFEITETGSIENLHKAADFVRTLKNIGCKFSLDDFGTGLASHTYLKELPVDYVKIDGSFISDVNENRTDFAMAKSITDLAHFLGQKTIAECVENLDLVPALREIGVDYLQGWGIGMPRFLHEIVEELPDLET